MDATLAAARAGVTTGEWAGALRDVFGSYRAPTGVGEAAVARRRRAEALRDEVARVSEALGRTLKILVGKPGLDGHSNGAEQIAVRARDAGHGRRLRGHPADARADRALGGRRGRPRHRALDPLGLAPRADPGRDRGAASGAATSRSSSAASSPTPTSRTLKAAGVAAVYTPKDFELDRIMRDDRRRSSPSATASPPRRDGAERRSAARLRARATSPPRPRRCNAASSTGRPRTASRRAARAREVGARRARRRGAGPRRRRHRPAGRRQVDAALGARCASGASRGRTVAVLAVDPSSKRSGGALLGDRARIEHDPADRGVFIRSMAAGERLGGLAPATRAAAQALAAAFDVVVIETVGVGQSETEVAEAADTVAVVVQPGSGDVAAVPEGRDHGGARRARGHQGRPRRGRAPRAERDLARRAARARRARGAGRSPCPSIAARRAGSRRSPTRSTRTARRSTSPRARAARPAAAARSPTSSPEHGERGLRALGGRRAARALLEAQDPALDEPALVRALEAAAGI